MWRCTSGQIAFGNLGSPTRLDFTVIGQTVNLGGASGRPVLAPRSPAPGFAAFATELPDGAESLGVHQIRGLPEPEEVFTYPS